MYKIVLDAGHGINTAGRRCLKEYDPAEHREWWLNDRVCDFVESYLKEYEGYALLRVDDADDGEDNIELADRTAAANKWDADVYLSVHHNGGANGTSAGGIVCYSHPKAAQESHTLRDELYDALIAHTGLRGNRATPKATSNLYVLRKTDMPAVLMELGFMDSRADIPVIITDEFAQGCARAIVEVLAKHGGLTKKAAAVRPALYKVQCGAFKNKAKAEALAAELKAKGYSVYITEV